MTILVIDAFEVIEVQQVKRMLPSVLGSTSGRSGQSAEQPAAVRQLGERIASSFLAQAPHIEISLHGQGGVVLTVSGAPSDESNNAS